MRLDEAKKILNDNGYRVLSEETDFSSILDVYDILVKMGIKSEIVKYIQQMENNMIKYHDLPINNYKIDRLKKLYISLFNYKGNWQHTPDDGYELFAKIKTYINPERPFEFYVFINEKMTDQEIQEEIRQFKELTDGYKYIVI